jgi:hypothetical protein
MGSGFNRATLVYGGAGGGLGDVALRLVRFGLETSYAHDLDELILLALERERESGVGSVLVGSDRDPPVIRKLVDQLEQRVALPALSVVVVGSDLPDGDRESLRSRSLRWHLPGGFSDRALRFVASAATWERDAMKLR